MARWYTRSTLRHRASLAGGSLLVRTAAPPLEVIVVLPFYVRKQRAYVHDRSRLSNPTCQELFVCVRFFCLSLCVCAFVTGSIP